MVRKIMYQSPIITILIYRPDLGRLIVRAARKEISRGAPLYRIDLFHVALECFHRFLCTHLTDVNEFVRRARRERTIIPPIHVKRGFRVEVELLLDRASRRIPDDGGFIHTTREQCSSRLVPLK